ncbi:MAG: GTP pyrophosphokinase, partial [Thermoproteota archaeon]
MNGKIKTLNTEIENGDIIEIITAKNHTPSIDWLKFVKTSRAREKIKQEIKNRIGVSINAQKKEERREEATAGLVRVENAEDKKIKLALCCYPVPGD